MRSLISAYRPSKEFCFLICFTIVDQRFALPEIRWSISFSRMASAASVRSMLPVQELIGYSGVEWINCLIPIER